MSDDEQEVPSRDTSPADIHDPRLIAEARKASVWIGIAVLAGLAIYFSQSLLVIFGGLVFAAMIDGGARLLGRVLPIGRGWRVSIVLALTALFFVWLFYFAGSQIAAQAALFPAIIETQFNKVLAFAESHGLAIEAGDLRSFANQALSGVGTLTRALGGLIGGLTTGFLILILGIYIAAEPRLYERGVAWMLPTSERGEFLETISRMAHTMRRLLAGRLLGMVVEGVATWLLLEIYGVPMAALLGLLTGLLAFLPNIGAPISGALMILAGFSGGTDMGIYTIFVYVGVQTIDGYLVVPMVARKTVDLAPALVLGAQLVFGVMFGILGLALADPIVAMIKVALERRAERNNDAAATQTD